MSLRRTMALTRYHLHKRSCVGIVPLVCAFLCGVLLTALVANTKPACAPLGRLYDPENSYFLLLLIVTAPENFERRTTIRETYLNLRPRMINESYQEEVIHIPTFNEHGHLQHESVQTQRQLLDNYRAWLEKPVKNIKVINFKIKPLFTIGLLGQPKNIRRAIYEEQRVFGDILELEDLQDSYANLTAKVVESMKKIDAKYDFRYLAKLDDDTYVKLDLLAEDLMSYYEKLHRTKRHPPKQPSTDSGTPLELYWGYFRGAASIKKQGVWQEHDYSLCDRYGPYALGGGYVLSKGLVSFIASYADRLSLYKSEDISMGSWLAPFRNIHRRHDVRFDTAWKARTCKNYHLLLHKRTAQHMRELYAGEMCSREEGVSEGSNPQPKEYFYDWTQPPSSCCKTGV
ncbi:beta-1,3-galactosyltransferase 6 [Anopheles ziemanni]|uniref:beta-1,3-galactosyltransferase 6 n=1 Tax=Anopheles coustani TaxID=139045 RepID=UPI002658D49E|nr:beta-1,3-galactosyltransferase 6 [Anopheles coustani]XP_058169219.1 beta-1,3-galactosyltransferase 6 [Anopheles ziemanni]